MNREQAKKLLKLATFIYVASFFIINWNDVSWIFNYRATTGLIGDFFNPYPSTDVSSANSFFYPNHSSLQIPSEQNLAAQAKDDSTQVEDVKTSYTDKRNALKIPKISISVPVVFSTSADKNLILKDLDSGVVYYPGSVYPGQKGQIVILGHSAPPNWPKIKYDWVFNDLDKLSAGDVVYVDFNNKQYKFMVKQTKIIERGQTVESDPSKSTLILISCYPPGKDDKRIAVVAELVDN